jgi:uncharacterized protein (TIGR00290 family)
MRTILSWSSGKDSAWSLHVLRAMPGIEVVGLLTTLNEAFDRIAMHAVRRTLVEVQADAAGLPLHIVPIPFPCPNEVYEERMGRFVSQVQAAGVEAVAFGDLFLEDIRRYREDKLRGTGLTPLFPLWGRDTRELARDMIDGGLVAHLTCVDPTKLDPAFAGRRFDHALVADLPATVDPCGENGEFHTFVSAGPMLASSVPVHVGEIVSRDGFMFADLLAGEAGATSARLPMQPQGPTF